ncbi:MAG: ATP-binding cassette domain-containing protein [Corynebacterium sp.]|uniref:ABC transporter ATP-binding protein n=1 Tax=Corynebacterium sp. TaxID=1720 RepID=UPI0026E03426|nr:ATP-binding cassette domain-containing protein [Corynebacterium sp.]MDO5670127.1 ATP-binding cassette domain-containing protein [Corynebacterium sp.]
MNATTPESSPPVLEVRSLTKQFGQGGFLSKRSVTALRDVSFTLGKGEVVSLVGESGSGKSTIARIVARLEQPTTGTFLVDGRDIVATEGRRATKAYRRQVQMVFQDPFGSLNPSQRISHFLERPLVLHGMARGAAEVRERSEKLMRDVGLTPDMLDSFPHQLSGGQRQRVAIARALAVEPEVILADEPTSMLDVSVRIGVLNLMRDLCDKRGISILYITHDLASARYVSDRTIVLFAGEIVEAGPSMEVMAAPAHPYTRLLTSAVPDPQRTRVLDVHARAQLRSDVQTAMYGPGGKPGQPAPGTEMVEVAVSPGHIVRRREFSAHEAVAS